MSQLDIIERQMGDVTVLDLDGEIRIGEGSTVLRSAIRRLVEENKKKVVLNLAGVGYIDSSGNGELVSSYTGLRGKMKLAGVTLKVQDLLVITKLLTVYDVYETVEEAVNAFAARVVSITCPVHGCENLISFSAPMHIGTCTSCGSEVRLTPLPSDESRQVSISSLRLPTYESESIIIDLGAPTTIRIDGRLDLFASEVLERACLTVPPPRRVIFRVETASDITPLAVQRLLEFCAITEKGDAAVILALSKNAKTLFPASAPVYDEEHKAIAALGEISPVAKWILDISS